MPLRIESNRFGCGLGDGFGVTDIGYGDCPLPVPGIIGRAVELLEPVSLYADNCEAPLVPWSGFGVIVLVDIIQAMFMYFPIQNMKNVSQV